MLVASTPKEEMKLLSGNDIKQGLELLLQMYLRRFPYKEMGDQIIDLPDSDTPNETEPKIRQDDQAC